MMPQNTVALAIGGLTVLTAIPSLGNLGGMAGNLQEMRQEAARISDRSHTLQLAQQETESAAAIANIRYRESCLPVVDLASQQHYVSLVEGKPVIDSVSGVPLPAGTVVCDAHGNTAVLVLEGSTAVARHFAYTGDRTLIQHRLGAYIGASYTQPSR